MKHRVDSRDLSYHKHFGSTTVFPESANFDVGIVNEVELPGQVLCTAITTTDMGANQTKTVYDYYDLWDLTPKDATGADPRDSLKIAVNNGLQPLDKTKPRVKAWGSFYRGDTGPMDAFDNVRSCMTLANSPLSIGGDWFNNWNDVEPDGIMPEGDYVVSGHDFVTTGWEVKNGEPMLRIKAWTGHYTYMSRAVFNDLMGKWGAVTWMLATEKIADKQTKTWMMAVIDLLQNLLIILKKKYLLEIIK